MANTIAEATLLGYLGSDPKSGVTGSGKTWCRFSVSHNKAWKNKEGEKVEKVSWTNVVAWGNFAQAMTTLLKKGALVMVVGELEARSYEDKDGATRHVTEVTARKISLCSSKPASASAPATASVPAPATAKAKKPPKPARS